LTSFCKYDGVLLLRGTSGIVMYNLDLSQSLTRQAMCAQPNILALLFNNFCSGQKININYNECVTVFLP